MPTTPDWISAGANVALVAVAVFGFALTILVLIAGRNRQRTDIEGYVRVDVGPPAGTSDYHPPTDILHVESASLELVGDPSDDDPTISVWYRNLQTHPLGVALGIISRIVIQLDDPNDNYHEIVQTHEVAYLEPGGVVRVDAIRFPENWDCACWIEAIQYRNLDWDGSTPRHGRRECYYVDGQFEMVPWSDPKNLWRDSLRQCWAVVRALIPVPGFRLI